MLFAQPPECLPKISRTLWPMSSQSDVQRFARLVLQAFRDAGNVTDAEVGAAGGPSTTYMTQLRKAANGLVSDWAPPRSDTLRRIEQAAGWGAGSARSVWEGGNPRAQDLAADVRSILTSPWGPPMPDDPKAQQWVMFLLDGIQELERRVDVLQTALAEEGRAFAPAARDVGRLGSVRRMRDQQDQAGEPPADDSGDMEPR